jgi:hypothetical protein
VFYFSICSYSHIWLNPLVVDRHFWRQHKKIEIKNTAPIFGEKTTQVSSQLSVWAGSKFIKKKREHGIDE